MGQLREILISKFGRIRDKAIPIETGKLTLLRGQNGTGKSTAIAVAEFGLTPDAKTKDFTVTVTDGESRARAEIFGGIITMTEKRCAKTGEPQVKSVVGGKVLAAIVDPKIKDPVVADEERAKNLSLLFGIQGEPDVMREKIGLSESQFDDCFGEPGALLPWANEGRRKIWTEAQQAEESAVRAQARKDAQDGIIKSLKAEGAEGDEKETQKELEDAIADKATAEARVKARKELEQLTTVRATAEVQDELAEMTSSLTRRQEEIVKLEESIKRIKEGMKVDAVTHGELTKELARAQRRDEILADKATETPEDVQKRIDAARVKVAAAARVKDLRAAEAKFAAAMEDLEASTRRALLFRKASDLVDAAITEIVSQNVGYFIFEKGRILVDTVDRGRIFFSELSPGQRWTPVIASAAKLAGAGAFITIPQEAWEGLDPLNRAIVKEALLEYDVSAMSAECSEDGELTAIILN